LVEVEQKWVVEIMVLYWQNHVLLVECVTDLGVQNIVDFGDFPYFVVEVEVELTLIHLSQNCVDFFFFCNI